MAKAPKLDRLRGMVQAAHEEAMAPDVNAAEKARAFANTVQMELAGPSWRSADGMPSQEARVILAAIEGIQLHGAETFTRIMSAIDTAEAA